MCIDFIEHIEKFNPYHDERGRFASANRSTGISTPSAGTYSDGANGFVLSHKDYIGDKEIESQVNDQLRYHLGTGEEYAEVEQFEIIQYPTQSGMADVDVQYSVNVIIPNGDGTYERDTEYRTTTVQLKVLNKSIDTIEHV